MVVDDERSTRRTVARLLSEEGFRVFEAEDADEALEVMRQARGRVDLLIVDVVMPGCDGVELGRRILAEWPDQRLLYMSAHPAQILVQHGLERPEGLFLAKPFTRIELLTKVAEAMERRHAPRQSESDSGKR
jgi:DNA-binding response OmpR family regulator